MDEKRRHSSGDCLYHITIGAPSFQPNYHHITGNVKKYQESFHLKRYIIKSNPSSYVKWKTYVRLCSCLAWRSQYFLQIFIVWIQSNPWQYQILYPSNRSGGVFRKQRKTQTALGFKKIYLERIRTLVSKKHLANIPKKDLNNS